MAYFDRFQEPDEEYDPCENCKFDCSKVECEFKEEPDEEFDPCDMCKFKCSEVECEFKEEEDLEDSEAYDKWRDLQDV